MDKINSYMVVSEDNIMKHYSKVIREMQSNIKRSKTHEDEADIKMKRQEQSMSRIEDSISDLLQENERVEAEDRKTLKRLETEIDHVNKEMSGLSKRYDSMERMTQTIATDVEEVERSSNENEKENEHLRSKNDKFAMELAQNRRSITTMESKLSQINLGENANTGDVFNDMNNDQNQISKISDSVAMANGQINAIESRLSESEEKLVRLHEDDEKITKRMESLENTDIARRGEESHLEPLRSDITSMKQDIAKLMESAAAAEIERENLRSQMENTLPPSKPSNARPMSDNPTGIERQIMENANTIQRLRSNLDNANKKVDENKQEIVKIKQETRTLSTDMADSSNRLQALFDNVNDINVKTESMGKEVKDIKSVLDSVKDDKKKEMQALAEKQEQMSKWRDLEKRYQNFGESIG